MATNSFHQRVGDHKLSFGMVRYATGTRDTDDYIWRLIVSDYCGATKHASLDVTAADLVQIKSFCEKALEVLSNDGERKGGTK